MDKSSTQVITSARLSVGTKIAIVAATLTVVTLGAALGYAVYIGGFAK